MSAGGGYAAKPAAASSTTGYGSAGGYASSGGYGSTEGGATGGYGSSGGGGGGGGYASKPAGTYVSSSSGGAAVSSQQQMQSSWVLEPVTYQGVPYLLDRATSMVYANNQGWLQLVGQWQGGAMVQRKRNNTGELFKALDDLLRTQQVRMCL